MTKQTVFGVVCILLRDLMMTTTDESQAKRVAGAMNARLEADGLPFRYVVRSTVLESAQ
jgi:hypothetical protein